ncbi:MAG: flagellar basal body P-ring protein FlgI [Bythopirellula sp.]
MSPLLRPQSPETDLESEVATNSTLISNVAHPYGLGYIKLEAVSMVTGLNGTGEDPAPSPQRAALMDEMTRREVENPKQVLASPETALVLVRGFLRPGIQAGDRFDVEVRTSSRSDTTSLRGGHLLETRLSEMAVLGDQLRSGHLMAVSMGDVLVDPTAVTEEETALATRGRVLSGGVATKSRNLGLILDHDRQSIRLSQKVGKAINARFHSYIDGQKRGVATPKTDEFIELVLHPRYKDNVSRYMRVVRNIALSESSTQRQARLQLLGTQLLDPVTSATAALRLEAIGGDQAVELLSAGLNSEDPEVRFYAAETLAYLDETISVETLTQVVREEPAFRVNALAALSAMDDGAAYDNLRSLLGVNSAETRYGAFRAMTSMAPNDAYTRGEDLNGMFTYHHLDVSGPPMVHVTNSHRPEVVLFGTKHELKLPLVLDAGPKILVNGLSGGQIKVSQFGSTTQQRTVSNDVDSVIRAVVELGGTYPDVVQMLQQAKQSGALVSRFRVNALPEGGREFLRDELRVASRE